MRRIIYSFLAILLPTVCLAIDDIVLPPGFAIEEFAAVPNARSLALGDRGTVFVSNRRQKSVYAVISDAGQQRVVRLLKGLNSPNGIAFYQGDLFVAEIDRVTRYRDIESRLDNVPDAEVLPIELPSKRHHGWRYIAFGPDGKLYISIGAPCNVCDDDGFATIIRVNTDGTEREVVAHGVRNSVGLTWHPETQDLWFTDNGRDMLGDDIPPCELNRVTEVGQHFGFPHCHGNDVLDPQYGAGQSCSNFVEPVQQLGAHVAPLGLTFYDGTQFPEEYRGRVFIAEHGSWNRSKKVGYRVTMLTFRDGIASDYETFASGWLQGQSASGRPVDLLVMPDGSLLVSDDQAGMIYKVTYVGKGAEL